MRTSYLLIDFCAIRLDIFQISFFSPVYRIPICFVMKKYNSIANFFASKSFHPVDNNLSYLGKEPEPIRMFGTTVSPITIVEVKL